MTTEIDANYNRSTLKALLKWYADAGYPRAHFIVDSDVCELPEPFQRTADEMGHVTMNLAWQATRDMVFEEDGVSFSAKCGGYPYNVFISYISLVGYITNYGFTMWNYLPNAVTPVAGPAANDSQPNVDTSYLPKMLNLQLSPTEAKEVRDNTVAHLKLIQNNRTPVVNQPVDPKNPSYPFPVDRFAEYNGKQTKQQETKPQDDVIFKGTPGGIEFHSRKAVPRVRPSWLKVIDGGNK